MYLRMDQVKFVEDSVSKILSDMILSKTDAKILFHTIL